MRASQSSPAGGGRPRVDALKQPYTVPGLIQRLCLACAKWLTTWCALHADSGCCGAGQALAGSLPVNLGNS
jgi:hypothetical protein